MRRQPLLRATLQRITATTTPKGFACLLQAIQVISFFELFLLSRFACATWYALRMGTLESGVYGSMGQWVLGLGPSGVFQH